MTTRDRRREDWDIVFDALHAAILRSGMANPIREDDLMDEAISILEHRQASQEIPHMEIPWSTIRFNLRRSMTQFAKIRGIYLDRTSDGIFTPYQLTSHCKRAGERARITMMEFFRRGFPLNITRIKYEHGTLQYSDWQDIERAAHLGEKGCEEIEELLDACGAFSWEAEYKDPGICDGMSWRLIIAFEDGTAFLSTARNIRPEGYEELVSSLESKVLTARDLAARNR